MPDALNYLSGKDIKSKDILLVDNKKNNDNKTKVKDEFNQKDLFYILRKDTKQ